MRAVARAVVAVCVVEVLETFVAIAAAAVEEVCTAKDYENAYDYGDGYAGFCACAELCWVGDC